MVQDLLELKYIPLDELIPLEGNAKKHDTENTLNSIIKYGFRDPIAIDINLNAGKGAIVEGHDRRSALLLLKERGEAPPRGIKLDKNNVWHVPVLFGVDAETEEKAIAYNIEHNLSTLKGAGFNVVDELKLFDVEELLGQISYLIEGDENLVGFNDLNELSETLNSMLDTPIINNSAEEENDFSEEAEDFDYDVLPESNVKMVQLFLTKETHLIFSEYVETLNDIFQTSNPTDCVMEAMKRCYADYKLNR